MSKGREIREVANRMSGRQKSRRRAGAHNSPAQVKEDSSGHDYANEATVSLDLLMLGPTPPPLDGIFSKIPKSHPAWSQLVSHEVATTDHFRRLGGGWHTGFELRRASGLRFAVLIAPNAERVRRRAPMLLAARNEMALRDALRTSCSMLDDVVCVWVKAIESDVAAIVDEELLRDACVAGSA